MSPSPTRPDERAMARVVQDVRLILSLIEERSAAGQSTSREALDAPLSPMLALSVREYLDLLVRYAFVLTDYPEGPFQLSPSGEGLLRGNEALAETLALDAYYHFTDRLDALGAAAKERIGYPLDHRYLRGGRIGKGGLGSLYEGEQLSTGRAVAIKMLEGLDELFRLDQRPGVIQRVDAAVRAQARLSSPFIVQILDQNPSHTPPYIVMELAAGGDLRRLLNQGPLPAQVAVRYFVQLTLALKAAHAQGLVHRDLKPENILLDAQGNLKLADLGITYAIERGEGMQRQAYIGYGSIGYMAPELFRPGQESDASVDLYALGILLFEMLTGTLPGRRSPMPSEIAEGAPTALDEIFDRLTQDLPQRRYESADALLEAIWASPEICALLDARQAPHFVQSPIELPGTQAEPLPSEDDALLTGSSYLAQQQAPEGPAMVPLSVALDAVGQALHALASTRRAHGHAGARAPADDPDESEGDLDRAEAERIAAEEAAEAERIAAEEAEAERIAAEEAAEAERIAAEEAEAERIAAEEAAEAERIAAEEAEAERIAAEEAEKAAAEEAAEAERIAAEEAEAERIAAEEAERIAAEEAEKAAAEEAAEAERIAAEEAEAERIAAEEAERIAAEEAAEAERIAAEEAEKAAAEEAAEAERIAAEEAAEAERIAAEEAAEAERIAAEEAAEAERIAAEEAAEAERIAAEEAAEAERIAAEEAERIAAEEAEKAAAEKAAAEKAAAEKAAAEKAAAEKAAAEKAAAEKAAAEKAAAEKAAAEKATAEKAAAEKAAAEKAAAEEALAQRAILPKASDTAPPKPVPVVVGRLSSPPKRPPVMQRGQAVGRGTPVGARPAGRLPVPPSPFAPQHTQAHAEASPDFLEEGDSLVDESLVENADDLIFEEVAPQPPAPPMPVGRAPYEPTPPTGRKNPFASALSALRREDGLDGQTNADPNRKRW